MLEPSTLVRTGLGWGSLAYDSGSRCNRSLSCRVLGRLVPLEGIHRLKTAGTLLASAGEECGSPVVKLAPAHIAAPFKGCTSHKPREEFPWLKSRMPWESELLPGQHRYSFGIDSKAIHRQPEDSCESGKCSSYSPRVRMSPSNRHVEEN
jgi:hypothetical protein